MLKEETKRDLYEVLEVARDASQEEVKKAYRAKAMKFHPDRNRGDRSAESRFKEASEAYEALGDVEKRQRYDAYGFAGLKGTDYRPFTSSDDIFSSFGDIFGDFLGFGRGRQARRRGADLRYLLELTFEEAALGVTKTIEFEKPVLCSACSGSRAEPGTEPEICTQCQGRGQVLRNHGFLNISTTCPACGGAGKVIAKPCRACKGEGQTMEEHSLEAPIPAGVEDDALLRMRGEGLPGPAGGPSGDLLIGISVKEHEIFQRHGADLFMLLPISFVQAALGDEIEVPTLEESRDLKIPPGTQPGTILRLDGAGIKIGRQHGDLHAQVNVKIPADLTAEQKKILKDYAATEGAVPKGKKWWQL
jgi:molecular chaperone DnaJ